MLSLADFGLEHKMDIRRYRLEGVPNFSHSASSGGGGDCCCWYVILDSFVGLRIYISLGLKCNSVPSLEIAFTGGLVGDAGVIDVASLVLFILCEAGKAGLFRGFRVPSRIAPLSGKFLLLLLLLLLSL